MENLAEVIYTYEKVEDKIKITSTTTEVNESSKELTIADLENQKASLEVSKTNTLIYYNDNIARLNEEIAVIEGQILEAGKLGVVKKDIQVK